MKTNFADFTNLYEISKTLRFELKPLPETQKLLEENQVFKKDKVIKEAYDKIKPFLDRMHRIFINKSLKNTKLNLKEVYENFLELEKTTDKKQKDELKKEFEKSKKKLRKQIANSFKKTGEAWKNTFEKEYIDEKGKKQKVKIKGDYYKILLSETNLNILYELFPKKEWQDEVLVVDYDGKKKNIFKIFKGFTTYFTNFNHSRENFYLDDGKSGRIATRIIDENMIFFFKNKKNFDKFYLENDNLKNKLQKLLDNYGEKLEDFFNLENFNNCLIGEKTDYYNKIIGELNKIINLEKQAKFSEYKQKKKAGEEIKFNKNNYPVFKELYKQILSEKENEQKFIEIHNFNELNKYLQKFRQENDSKLEKAKKLVNSILENYEIYDFSKIYISKRPALHTLSAKYFGPKNWGLIEHYLLENIGEKNIPDFIDLENIKIALEKAQEESEEEIFKDEFKEIEEQNVFKKFLKIFQNEFFKLVEKEEKNRQELEKNILTLENFSKNNEGKEKQIENIKDYLDTNLNIYRMIKYFALEKAKENKEAEYEIDDDFYNLFKEFYINNEIIKYYNEFRNYLTKKPYSQDKIKLNFEKGTLLKGWPDSPEGNTQYYAFIFRKNQKYYLGITDYSRILDPNKSKEAYNIEGGDFYEKMTYKQTDGKTIYGSNYTGKFGKKYADDKKKLSDKELINRVKEILKDLVIFYPILQNIINKEYFEANDLATDISKTPLYSINFNKKISSSFLENGFSENGKNKHYIYLFEIYNKDFSGKKTGKENLHTMYFKGLFDKKNLKNIVLKLNGQAEIFRREASLKEKKNIITAKNNRLLPDNIFHKKRYYLDKILFHCPIKLNFAKKDNKIDEKIREFLAENKQVNIIGIDRGEKHLAYYSVINQKGKILECGSFNEIGGKNYFKELVKREEERQKARGSWKTIGTIKELKEGYISQVIHKLAELIIKYNAIIVFEDLNSGFKRGRQKIERQVYQKFEKALIEKLNYLVFKDKKPGEKGHFLQAYQLTSFFETFEKIGKQTGVIFYTNPSYTSQTCPKCGFRKTIYLKYTNLNKAKKEFREKIERFYFDEKNNEFIFEYNNLQIHTNRDRKKNISSEESGVKGWKTIDYNIVEELKKILEENNIDYKTGESLIKKIIEKNNKSLYEGIFYNFNMATKIRNSVISDNSKNGDFISCPVCNFDSRKDNKIGVESGDANGAYNIARKGIIILEKINNWKKSGKDLTKMKWKDLFVSMDDWDKFLENK